MWQQLLTTTSMPANSVGFDASGYFIGLNGTTELRIAPSNPQIMYALYQNGEGGGAGVLNETDCGFYVSTNGGATWTLAHTFSALFNGGDWNNHAYAQNGYQMAVDPADPTTVLVGTPLGGLFYTTNSGAAFTQVSSAQVPIPLADNQGFHPNICGIAFDPTSGTTGGRTNKAYVVSFGNGTYTTSTSVTGTWSAVPGTTPKYCEDAMCSGGNYYVAGSTSATAAGGNGGAGSQALLKYVPGTGWTTLRTDTTSNIHTFDINPNDSANIVYAGTYGQLLQTNNGGTNWFDYSYGGTGNNLTVNGAVVNGNVINVGSFGLGGTFVNGQSLIAIGGGIPAGTVATNWNPGTNNLTVSNNVNLANGQTFTLMPPEVQAQDCPWLGQMQSPFVIPGASGKLFFDKVTANKLWLSTGIGVFYTLSLTSSSLASGSPVLWKSQSAGIESLTSCKVISLPSGGTIDASLDFGVRYHSSPTAYPLTLGVSQLGNICGAFDVDYAKDGSGYAATICNNFGLDTSGYFDGSNWHQFTNPPTGSGGGGVAGGMIAMASQTSIVAYVGNATTCVFSTNTGGSWANSTGLPASGWPFSGYFAMSQTLCADAAGNYYIMNSSNGLYKSSNGGSSFTRIDTTALNSTFQARMMAVPGVAQMLFFTAGQQSGTHPQAQSFYFRTSDGGAWSAMSNVEDVWAFGFGKAAPGFSNPTLWIVGYVNDGSGYKYGIWVSKDATTTPGSANWTLLTTYPGNNPQRILMITGDYNDASKCYFAFNIGYGRGLNLVY